ncbi:MAG TPA: flagellar biosynthesis anti-sigma factor FlgM [Steroidobacteraceae bacterium]
MSSKIGGVDGSSPSTAIGAGRAVQRPQDAATGGTQNSQGSSGGGSSVQITGAARQLASLEQAVRDLPAVNDARVAQISNDIEQGSYTVDAKQIANQLIQMEKALAHAVKDSPNSSRSDTDPEPDAD